MTEPNQVRPIMKIVNQVRELIIDAHNAGELKGIAKGRKEVVEWFNRHKGAVFATAYYGENTTKQTYEIDLEEYQAQFKKWGIE